MKAKRDALAEALNGMFASHHGEIAQMLLDQIGFLDKQIARATMLAGEQLGAIRAAWGIDDDGGTGRAPARTTTRSSSPRSRGWMRSRHQRRAGCVDHRRDRAGHDPVPRGPPGVLGRAVPPDPPVRPPHPPRQRPRQQLPARLPRPGRQRRGGTATFLGERHARIARRRGGAKAQVAIARSILVIIWHLLHDPAARYTDLGPGHYQTKIDKNRKARSHIRQLEALGYTYLTQAA